MGEASGRKKYFQIRWMFGVAQDSRIPTFGVVTRPEAFQLPRGHTKPIFVLTFMGRRFHGCMGPRVHEQMASKHERRAVQWQCLSQHRSVTRTLLLHLRAPAAAYDAYTRTHTQGEADFTVPGYGQQRR